MVKSLLIILVTALGIFFILRIGEGLTAPVAIGGEWQLKTPLMDTCGLADNWSDPTRMTIVQSGQYLDVRLGGVHGMGFSARIEGERITGDGRVSMNLGLQRQSEVVRMVGNLALADCDFDQPVIFERQPGAEEIPVVELH